MAGTPIGDVSDAPPRLLTELAAADVIAAEDTRRLRRLTQALGVTPAGRVLSYFEGNEVGRTPELVEALLGGARVLLVTDAGMPSVSDPGYRLVAAAVAADVKVTAVPGPSAVLTALALSGLPVDRFTFEGFLPRKTGDRARQLATVAAEPRTMVFFEAPHRIAEALAAMAEAFGADRPAAVCRELTKTYEEVKRGPIGELAAWAAEGVRGDHGRGRRSPAGRAAGADPGRAGPAGGGPRGGRRAAQGGDRGGRGGARAAQAGRVRRGGRGEEGGGRRGLSGGRGLRGGGGLRGGRPGRGSGGPGWVPGRAGPAAEPRGRGGARAGRGRAGAELRERGPPVRGCRPAEGRVPWREGPGKRPSS